MSNQSTETNLWCMHAIGPDDMFAAPSREEAERAAAWYTERFKDHEEVRFEAIPWPHSADSHAVSVVDWDVGHRNPLRIRTHKELDVNE